MGDVVSELLSALLNRLTELEQHEKELRACQSLMDEVRNIFYFLLYNLIKLCYKIELIKWPSATQLAQILCRIERKLARHIGPEEFVQCSSSVYASRRVSAFLFWLGITYLVYIIYLLPLSNLFLNVPAQSKISDKPPPTSMLPLGALDSKKTCNLEIYLDWSARLRLLVSNEVLLVTIQYLVFNPKRFLCFFFI